MRELNYDLDLITPHELIHKNETNHQDVLFLADYLSDLAQLDSKMTCKYSSYQISLACELLAVLELNRELKIVTACTRLGTHDEIADCVL